MMAKYSRILRRLKKKYFNYLWKQPKPQIMLKTTDKKERNNIVRS